MNIRQAVKMAWRSILGKKGRSVLTMLGIIIGIAAVMTIVSAMNGYTVKTMEQYAAMGSNKISVSIYTWMYDEDGNSLGKDYFPDLYDFCGSIKEYVAGVTPEAYCSATVSYGTKSTANMTDYYWDDNGNIVGDMPPDIYYASDQYSACNNLTIASGRDLAILDVENYNQVCVMGAQAAKTFFGSADPVGKTVQVNGQGFDVVGVFAPRLTGESASGSRIDNIIILPYTARRLLGDEAPTSFTVKAKDPEAVKEASARIAGFLKGLVDTSSGGYDVYPEDRWQQAMNEQMGMISLVLGGIAAISLLVGGIGIMNIMLVTVTERTREIGIRRAIGAQRGSIVAQFLIEAAMLCGIGGIIGIGLGTVGSYIVGRLMFQMTIYPAAWITACAFSLSVALGIIFGIYPAAKAANLQPVEALRAE
nr:ABC transporter permease [uncultured Oscillibacter sp.]